MHSMAMPAPGQGRPRPSASDYRVALVLPRQGPAGIFGLDVQDLGALQTGLSKDEFKARLLAAGA